ncbi:MAG: helix-turn-helix domain-containing protein [Methylomonas sp.]
MSEIDLKPMKLKVAGLLAVGVSVTKAAELSDCSRQSVYRWLKDDDEFVAYLNGLKNEQIESVRSSLQAAAGMAVRTIISLMKNSTNEAVKLSAAKELLNSSGVLYSLPSHFNDDLENLRSVRKMNESMNSLTDDINRSLFG